MNLKKIFLYLLCPFYITAGIFHFIRTDFYLRIMPPYLPFHLELVYLSGVIEILLGILIAIPQTKKLAAWGIIVLLIAVFPANLNMLINSKNFPDHSILALWLRLPMQGVLIYWAWVYTRNESIK